MPNGRYTCMASPASASRSRMPYSVDTQNRSGRVTAWSDEMTSGAPLFDARPSKTVFFADASVLPSQAPAGGR